MRYETMKSDILPAAVLINNFVHGISPYTYEEYLIEIVNEIPHFLEKTKEKHYTHPLKEDHGECDCISSGYTMDFKLVVSESRLRALSLFSCQIVAEKGVVGYCVPRMCPGNKRYKPITATRIFAALRDLSCAELIEIRRTLTAKDCVTKDIQLLLETLETDKNLFLFFPYNIYFDDDGSFEEGLSIALSAIGRDFHNSLLYRSEYCPGRDTYFCFIYAKRFIISVWQDDSLRFLDAIPVEKSPLFMRLLYYRESPFDGEVLK